MGGGGGGALMSSTTLSATHGHGVITPSSLSKTHAG